MLDIEAFKNIWVPTQKCERGFSPIFCRLIKIEAIFFILYAALAYCLFQCSCIFMIFFSFYV